ncbi:MAG TPA: hypothetical protein VNA25_16660 [Phycisphaerae bacterium]|nr:hypothetical protein [Phycisphaerae bacterium]
MGIIRRCAAVAAVVLCCAWTTGAAPYAIPDAEMANQFVKEWGYSTLDGKTDIAGPGVRFDFTLSDSNDPKIGVGDNWPVSSDANLGWDDGGGYHAGHYTSLADYDSIEMLVRYVSGPAGSDIDVHLFMNTGLTGPSGYPNGDGNGDATNDTFWGSAWASVPVGGQAVVTLDFDLAEAWNISDNKVPHTGGGLGWADGNQYAVNDRDRHEVSHIGFEVSDFDGDAVGESIQVVVMPDPLAAAMLSAAAVWWLRRRRRFVGRSRPVASGFG